MCSTRGCQCNAEIPYRVFDAFLMDAIEKRLITSIVAVSQHLHNTFLVVSSATTPMSESCVVDPTFRSNFEISCSCGTAEYAAALPSARRVRWQYGTTHTGESFILHLYIFCALTTVCFPEADTSTLSRMWRTSKAFVLCWSKPVRIAMKSVALWLLCTAKKSCSLC